ncbi:hypothetical protein JS530_03145 [Bifidobacterium sp. LC6]|uniref:ABC transporter permease n=1 Tax=Bifidobacterium colobi TaxID=2809026 RepID=A0ABS5UV53_9BIFI|nr:hypothetical protein [Bifidobacterium colobi]MBT1174514.1 hypothetical protein [Bifidobacterium colobi]
MIIEGKDGRPDLSHATPEEIHELILREKGNPTPLELDPQHRLEVAAAKGDRDAIKELDDRKKEAFENSAANGGPTLKYGEHGLFALSVENLRGPKPGGRVFSRKGVVLKALLFVVLFVASVVVQVAFMAVTKANGGGDWWPVAVFYSVVPLAVVVFLLSALSPFAVLLVGSVWPRLTRVYVPLAVLAMLAGGSFVGQEIGRVWLWYMYVVPGRWPADSFVDLSSYTGQSAPLYQPSLSWAWIPGLAAGLLILVAYFVMASNSSSVWGVPLAMVASGGGVVSLIVALGIMLSRHAGWFVMACVPVVALFAIMYAFSETAAIEFCVKHKREACGEWSAAFWITVELMVFLGICTALPMSV